MRHISDRLLHWLSSDPLQRRNVFWMVAAELFTAAGAVFIAGPVLQTYLVEVGLSESQIGVYGSIGAIAATVGTLVLMGVADRVHRRIRVVMVCGLIASLGPLVLMLLSGLPRHQQTAGIVLTAIVVLALLLNPVSSFLGMVQSSLMVRVIHVRVRGRLTGMAGLISGVVALGLGLLAAKILDTVEFPRGFTTCFALATPLCIAGALARGRLVELPKLKRPGRGGSALPWAAIWEVARLREFRILLGPNAMRGVNAGVVYFAWIVGLQRLDLPTTYVGFAVAINAVAGRILGTMSAGLCSDRWGPGKVVLAGDTLTAIALVGMVLTSSPTAFLVLYALSVFGGTLEGTGVPLGTYEIVAPEVIGAFNGARLMLLSGGGAVSMSLVGWLLASFDPRPVFIVGAVLMLMTGIWYWRGFQLQDVAPPRQAHSPSPTQRNG
jgi:MFS family permease